MRLLPPMKTALFILLQRLLPQHFLSRLTGKLASWQAPQWFLLPLLKKFVKKYHVDMTQAENPDLASYASFNQFFTRALAADARPLGTGITSPADGTISELGRIDHHCIMQAKSTYYRLQQLLAGNAELTQTFTDGSFATIYLSPRDYHRVHMPLTGTLIQSIYVPGSLFSVNPTTVNHIAGVFARNERLISIFDTEHGPMAVILVGAMLVAGISTVWQKNITPNRSRTIQTWDHQQQNMTLKQGDELGYFSFGSTVIVLFAKDKMNWQPTLQAGTELSMGESIGQ